MAIITRKIGNKEYAYLLLREEGKSDRLVSRFAEEPTGSQVDEYQKESSAITARLHSLFWDTSLEKIHMKRNARYIIERLLELGDMCALEWLQGFTPPDDLMQYLNQNITKNTETSGCSG